MDARKKVRSTAAIRRITDSSSTKSVSFSSARTMNRRLSPRCASAKKIRRPLESAAETQPQLQPALLRLSAINFPAKVTTGPKVIEIVRDPHAEGQFNQVKGLKRD